jgi:hypothetical protein
MDAAELERAAWDAVVGEQVAAAERIVECNPEWRLAPLVDSLYSYALVHCGTNARALLCGKLWQGPATPDETGDIPLYRNPVNALKALGFDVTGV